MMMMIRSAFIGIQPLLLPMVIIALLLSSSSFIRQHHPQQQQRFLYCDAFQISTRSSSSSSAVAVAVSSRIKYPSFISQRTTVNRRNQRIRSSVTYLQQQQQSSSSSSKTGTDDVIQVNGSSSLSSSWTNNNNNIAPPKIPFMIECIPNNPSSALYQEIAQMCITAFFNTDNNVSLSQTQQPMNNNNKNKNGKNIPIWKEWQLAYLRTLQAGDLERRRKREPLKNRMFLARQVIPLTSSNSPKQQQQQLLQRQLPRGRPLVLDTSLIRNLDKTDQGDVDYMYGDIIGFVEVTQRPYGLGEEGYMVERYVLTNLSVDRKARQSGVGTALVNVCEQTIYSEYCRDQNNNNGNSSDNSNTATNGLKLNNKNSVDPTKKSTTTLVVVPEIVLEVEDDNINAINFYRKRKYMDVCVDPTSRRYDLSGLWLQQIRCKRLIMKKDLRTSMMTTNGSGNNNSIVTNMENTMTMGLQALQRFRDSLLNVQ